MKDTEIEFAITGYGNDGNNEGVSVELVKASDRAKEAFKKIPLAHITLSTSEYGKPVDTARLDFRPVCKNVRIRGKYGAYTDQKAVIWN